MKTRSFRDDAPLRPSIGERAHQWTKMARLCAIFASVALLGRALPATAVDPSAATKPPDLGQINHTNVQRLTLVSSFRLDRVGAEMSPPVFHEGTLFVLTSFPHTLFALDPAGSAAHRVKWQYTPAANRRADGLACCDRSRHGPVVDGGRVYFTTLDGHAVSLDLEGRLRWNVALTDLGGGEILVGPPTVSGGRVLVGAAGDDNGARGWIAALDAATGRTLWKRYSVGADSDVGIGPGFVPFYAVYRGRDLGKVTWPPGAWQQGGGGVAGPILVDVDAGLVFHGTGHPAPWNPDQRVGVNRWTSGLFARDAATGEARWFDSFNPHNPFGFREGADVLAEMRWRGQLLHLLVHVDANGFLYVVDRSTGQILAADPLVKSVVAAVDADLGGTTYHPAAIPRVDRQSRAICPAWTGGVGGRVGKLDAEVIVVPLSKVCMDIEPRPANYIRGTPYVGANVRLSTPLVGGGLLAWNVAARRASWQVDERFPLLGGVLATPGHLLFYGTLDGQLKALDAQTGKLRWTAKTPAGVASEPTTFVGADGRQFIAVVAGTGRLHGMSRKEALDSRDPSAGFGLAGLVSLLPADDDPSGTLLVFGLP